MCDDRPLLLDLCCGAGGAARGYVEAGFAVLGVDVVDQPRYAGNKFLRGDAMEVLRRGLPPGVAAVHASFPCQSRTAYRRKGHGVGDGYPNLIPEGRELLEATSLPYVIENVEGFRDEMRDPGATNRGHLSRRTVEVGVWRIPLDVQRRAMGVDWMELDELSEAIPPAYTRHVGSQLMAWLRR